jgi:hypothetical protein
MVLITMVGLEGPVSLVAAWRLFYATFSGLINGPNKLGCFSVAGLSGLI